MQTVQTMEYNWKNGRYKLTRIDCETMNIHNYNCVVYLQFDDKKIISAHTDNTIKVRLEHL